MRAWICGGLLAVVALTGDAQAEIYLNEVRIAGSQVELYNSGPTPVSIGGWKIQGDLGEFVIPTPTTINSGEHKVFAGLGGIFEPIGGLIGVLDDVGSGTLRDRVRYGVLGGAPSPPPASGFSVSLSRSPDASNNPAPPLIPNADELFWTIDFSSTFGAANDVPNPNLGRDLCINEMLSDPNAVLADSVEFCNPPLAFTSGGVDLSDGYLLTTAFGVQELTGIVPAGGFLGVAVDPDLQLGDAFRVDLFAPDGVRIYQKSTYGASEPRNPCYGDCPDGAAPPDGYDFITSGGWVTFFPLECTIGFANTTADEDCRPAGLPGDEGSPVVIEKSWGEIKSWYGVDGER